MKVGWAGAPSRRGTLLILCFVKAVRPEKKSKWEGCCRVYHTVSQHPSFPKDKGDDDILRPLQNDGKNVSLKGTTKIELQNAANTSGLILFVMIPRGSQGARIWKGFPTLDIHMGQFVPGNSLL